MKKLLNKNTTTLFLQKYGLVVVILLMCVVVGFIRPTFLTGSNFVNILRQVSVNGIIAVGMTFILITGQIDISVGALVAVAGVVSGSIIVATNNVFLAIVAAVAICAVMGFASGSMVAYFQVPPMIATLSMMTIARGFALMYSGGATYQVASSKAFSVIGKGSLFPDADGRGGIPILILIMFAVIILFMIILDRTKFGRRVFAVGGNYKASLASGINCKRVITQVFVISGALSGLAGVVLASRIGAGQPAIGVGYEMEAIASCVIGGTSTLGGLGSIRGTVIGIIIMGLITNALTMLQVDPYHQQIVRGLMIAVAVIFDMMSKRNAR